MIDPGADGDGDGDDLAEECARQVAEAAAADRGDPELMSFVDAALEDLEDLHDWT